MNRFILKPLAFAFLAGCFCVAAFGQNADASASIYGKPDDRDGPRSLKEMLFKMQVEQEKKDFREMLDRGEEAVRLTEQVEKSYEAHGALTDDDKRKIDSVGKLVKKIRGELGGSDDDGDDNDSSASEKRPTDVLSGVKYLRESTSKLLSELKKTSRFSISAMAIQSSNAVLKATRFLRFGN